MINQKYKLNLIPGGIPIRVPVSQFDLNSRTIEFELFKGNVKFEAPGDTKCIVQGLKSDGTGFVYDVTINKNIAKFELKEQMTIIPGVVECELKFTNGNEVLATARFDLVVKRSPIVHDSVISKSEIPALVKLAKEQEENAKKYAEQAKQNNAIATNAVGRIGLIEQDAKNHANQAKQSEKNAQTSATEALHQANNASDHASKALEFKDQAKASEAKANEFMEEAKKARDVAAGYAGASTYSFMIDSEGYICLNHKEEK